MSGEHREVGGARRFVKLSTIVPGGQPSAVLTLDIDWAHDEVLADAIDLVEAAGVPATWFVTHRTVLLDRIRANPMFELGLHPNFNQLLDGQPTAEGSAEAVVRRLIEIAPEARCLRSHSATVSSRLIDLFGRLGMTHSSNYFMPWYAHRNVVAWQHPSGLTEVPYFWTDDVGAMRQEPNIPAGTLNEVSVYNFHPIHLFLNTSALSQYEDTRALHRQPNLLRQIRSSLPNGARDLLRSLLSRTTLSRLGSEGAGKSE